MLGGLFKGSEVTSGKVWKSFTEISSSLDRLLSLLSFDSFHDSSSKVFFSFILFIYLIFIKSFYLFNKLIKFESFIN